MTNTVTNTSRCCLRFNHKCDYGWVVVFASFLALFAMYGVQYTYGIFQQQYQDIYRGRATTTSLSFIGSVSFASLGLFGVFTGRLGDRLGYRITMLIGTLLMCLGLLLASWATEVSLLHTNGGTHTNNTIIGLASLFNARSYVWSWHIICFLSRACCTSTLV
jgi:MFS family permease